MAPGPILTSSPTIGRRPRDHDGTPLDPFPPHRYPWTHGDLGDLAASDTTAGLDHAAGRMLVVGVGSNASAAVLRRKLAAASARSDRHEKTPVPLARVVVEGIGIGYSAHVARRGYVPAAPFADPGGAVSAVGAWLDEAEVTALDATEPNYDRLTVGSDRHPGVRLRGGAAGPGSATPFCLYISRYGVLADRDRTPLRLGDQRRVFAWLADRLRRPSPAGDTSLAAVLDGDPADVCARLAAPHTAARVGTSMRSAGLVADAGWGPESDAHASAGDAGSP